MTTRERQIAISGLTKCTADGKEDHLPAVQKIPVPEVLRITRAKLQGRIRYGNEPPLKYCQDSGNRIKVELSRYPAWFQRCHYLCKQLAQALMQMCVEAVKCDSSPCVIASQTVIKMMLRTTTCTIDVNIFLTALGFRGRDKLATPTATL
ncbi:hypothetical protein NDU88_001404 [Pleurodeles waltl]|uniref:Uncharacterized protein n=1 Tax=Pleurodeles waltl TaxID=8319 RepID=A0AAV7U6A9_PLEWA|nr:hypothetical protein NDU88_001404 [Pleurodeles waltl]